MNAYEYPTDEQEQEVSTFKIEWLDDGKFPVYAPWFDLIKSLWWMPDWGWHERDGIEDGEPVTVFNISTGGWSGNESLIRAMRENWWNWHQSWHEHRRGGHYEFRIPRRVEKSASDDAVATSSE